MKRIKPAMIAVSAIGFLVVAGCGQESFERQNDAGPPVQMNTEGPGPMMPPSEEGGSTLPQGMLKGK